MESQIVQVSEEGNLDVRPATKGPIHLKQSWKSKLWKWLALPPCFEEAQMSTCRTVFNLIIQVNRYLQHPCGKKTQLTFTVHFPLLLHEHTSGDWIAITCLTRWIWSDEKSVPWSPLPYSDQAMKSLGFTPSELTLEKGPSWLTMTYNLPWIFLGGCKPPNWKTWKTCSSSLDPDKKKMKIMETAYQLYTQMLHITKQRWFLPTKKKRKTPGTFRT